MSLSLHRSFQQIPFTKPAYEAMEQDKVRLEKERSETLERLKIAREQGDLSENGAYRYAKMELGNIARQLRRLQYLLRVGYIATKSEQTNTVGFGNTITLKQGETSQTYTIVSKHESNPERQTLSTESPIGKAVLGKKLGDIITVITPSGEKVFTLTQIA